MRICFIGDSFVNGVGDDTCLGWTGRLCSAARKAGRDVTRYDLGIRGDTSADIVARWHRETQARLPAGSDGRLVFSFGTNDCTPGEDAGGARVAPGRSLANARTILMEARGRWPTLMVGPPPVGDDPSTDERIAALSGSLGTLCAEIGVPYLAVFSTMAASEPWRREAAANDGSHPNAAGYAALAGIVAQWDAWRSWLAS
ncbi:MAG TPA: GDSL-type esterase/lipase family protein [Arenibaculum sp.]|nr:GDSL-type esterase/lipase family protein [Arenibaculum sp.]